MFHVQTEDTHTSSKPRNILFRPKKKCVFPVARPTPFFGTDSKTIFTANSAIVSLTMVTMGFDPKKKQKQPTYRPYYFEACNRKHTFFFWPYQTWGLDRGILVFLYFVFVNTCFLSAIIYFVLVHLWAVLNSFSPLMGQFHVQWRITNYCIYVKSPSKLLIRNKWIWKRFRNETMQYQNHAISLRIQTILCVFQR
jgi:hypothetical protein